MTHAELFAMFCVHAQDDDPRLSLKSPMVEGEYIYATNGHWMVRIPASAYDGTAGEVPLKKNYPKKHLGDMFSAAQQNAGELLALEPIPAPPQCEWCCGSGVLKAQNCKSCGGSGKFNHHQYTYGCAPCEATGRIKPLIEAQWCEYCSGRGLRFGPDDKPARYRGANISPVYLHLLSKLPGAKLAMGPVVSGAHRFTLDGDAEGIVMSCREST